MYYTAAPIHSRTKYMIDTPFGCRQFAVNDFSYASDAQFSVIRAFKTVKINIIDRIFFYEIVNR